MIRHLEVIRHARYAVRGSSATAREVWFLCHGYSQLAADFISLFEPIEDGARLLVAPEGLSRFYLGDGRGRVGASWMTREDREHEITDYVAYLDRVYDAIMEEVEREQVTVHVLGFSQGVATACRWAAHGRASVDHLVLWAEFLPPEFDTPASCERLAGMRITTVCGAGDEYLTEGALDRHRERLESLGLEFEELTFDGGHRLDRETLQRLVGR